MKIINKFIVIILFVFCNNLSAKNVDHIVQELDVNVINTDNLIKNQPKNRFVELVKMRGLNKITGKTSIIEAQVGDTIYFEKLEILLLKCWKSYPEENTENKLLLKIFENKHNKKHLIFYGWFFSSSPSISGLEHPLYDLKLLNCEKLSINKTKNANN